MESENWYINVADKETGVRKPDSYERVMEKWIKAKTKPKLILLDWWVAGDELIQKLRAIVLPVEGMKFKRI